HELALRPAHHADVSAGTDEHVEAAPQGLHLDLCGRGRPAEGRDEPLFRVLGRVRPRGPETGDRQCRPRKNEKIATRNPVRNLHGTYPPPDWGVAPSSTTIDHGLMNASRSLLTWSF